MPSPPGARREGEALPALSAQGLTDSGRPALASLVDPQRTPSWRHRMLLLLVVSRLAMLLAGLGLMWAYGQDAGPTRWLQAALVLACAIALTGPVCRRHARREPVSEQFILAQLLADVALLAFAFHQSGGIENPFLVFLTLPVMLAAYTLSARRLLSVIGAAALALLAVARFHHPAVPMGEGAHEVSEAIAVVVLVYFAYTVSRESRRHDREVALTRENAIGQRGRDAMQTVAAQAADAVGSPLATMSILTHEMVRGHMTGVERRAALGVLEQQIALCKENLSKLLASVGQPRADTGQRSDIAELLRAAACECELMNPRLRVVFERPLLAPPAIVDESSLFDAFVLMIQHCAQDGAGGTVVRIDAQWSTSEIRVRLCSELRPPADPDSGSDGVELAAALLGRFGGTVSTRRDGGELCMSVRLPIAAIGIARDVDILVGPQEAGQHDQRTGG